MTPSPVLTAAALVVLALATACDPRGARAGGGPAPAGESSVDDSTVRADTASLLGAGRIARLPAAERASWTRYVERSRATMRQERATMAAELRAAGLERMVPAPNVRAAFAIRPYMTPDWFRSDSGRRLAESVLSFQTPTGGWSKHVDYTQGARRPGMSWYAENSSWSYIGTLDNQATTTQIEFLALAHAATGDERQRAGARRGLAYLEQAQFPNGCWPQVYPLQGGYHDAATFNDDAIVNALRVLRDVGRDARGPYATVVDSAGRAAAGAALARGVDCLLASQVEVDGRRTVWGQQHDPLTLLPTNARSYELASLSGRESAGITEFLMTLPDPDARVVTAVHDAVDWFKAHAIHGYAYDFETGLRAEAGAGPIWARMTEIGTNKPIFSNRDGVKLYDYEQLGDRRRGYAWFSTEPAAVLERYERWAPRHPRR